MSRFLFILLFPVLILRAEKPFTVKYDLTPYAVDLIKSWDDFNQFPYDRHFAWEGESFTWGIYQQSTMSKIYTNATKAELEKKLNKIFPDLGFDLNKLQYELKINSFTSRNTSQSYTVGVTLKLTSEENVHRFIDWINDYHSNVSSNPFNGSISTPNVSAKFTVIRIPVESVRNKGLDFFPSANTSDILKFKNKEFEGFVGKIKKEFGESSVTQYLCRAVSGKTMVIRDVQKETFPETYNFIGENIETTHFDEKEQKWVKGVELKNISGVHPEFGEPRDFGTIIELTPQVEPDGVTVSLDLKPQFLQHLGWTLFSKEEDIRMPVIQTLNVETRITSKVGFTVPVSVSYYRDREKNLQKVVQPGEGKPLVKNCQIIYVSLDTAVDKKHFEMKDSDLTFYMTPLGNIAKNNLENLIGKDNNPSEKVKQLLIELGMTFGDGTFLHYNNDLSVVTTLNKVSEVKKLIKFLPKPVSSHKYEHEYYGYNNDLYASNMIIELDQKLAEEIGVSDRKDLLVMSKINKLLNLDFSRKGAEIVSLSSYNGQNGNTSVVSDNLEVYNPEGIEYKSNNGKLFTLPNFGDPTLLGNIFENTVQLDPDGRIIESEIKLISTNLLDWKSFKSTRTNALLSEQSLDTRIKGQIGFPIVNSFEVKNGKVRINLTNYVLGSLKGGR